MKLHYAVCQYLTSDWLHDDLMTHVTGNKSRHINLSVVDASTLHCHESPER